ncbi:exodeoxyribonuclease III [Arcanobacterium ihumii]|uniref:exodeoxyribonuclease III n=1 Tax=Arcanobacterium ihumii TaxID=2138162 RepID=UPI000F548EBF|nr:exodeoxyribonuclease III [Arcanobacterium ihumii]
MKLATWNINSARARADRVLDVLQRHDLDVLALQEIKCKPEQFPREQIEAAGYKVIAHGFNQWNGVALISRLNMADVRTSFPGQPGFIKGSPTSDSLFLRSPDPEARALGALINGVEIWSLYIPNGRAVGDPHYHYKLEFLDQLNSYAQSTLNTNPEAKIAFVGDWNVIPYDDDVWDPSAMEDGLYLSEPEREAFFALEQTGMCEVTRNLVTNYTYWDYQQLRFPKNQGMRIDYIYASPALASLTKTAQIDRDERKGKGASDHVPVIATFTTEHSSAEDI